MIETVKRSITAAFCVLCGPCHLSFSIPLQVITDLLPVQMIGLYFLEIFLAPFAENYFEIHLCACMYLWCILLTVESYTIAWIYHNLFINYLLMVNLGCLQFWAITNKATMNICIPIFFEQTYTFSWVTT